MSGSCSKNIRVVVRVRPPNTRELEQNQRTIIKCDTQHTLVFDPDEEEDEFFFHGAKQSHRDITRKQNKKLPMEFDEIFDDMSANADVFEAAMKPLVRSVMDGFNCSAFVYGATGAGKTYTMLGSDSQPGITFLTMAYLFECMEALGGERKFEIGVSYLEVYNEQVMNLLTRTGPLKLREDAGGVVVGGLKLQKITSARELLDLLKLGNQHRTQHPTDANAESSRSHAIFQVHIRMVNLASGQKNTVKLSMIDLAGSERAASTKGIGVRFKEGASINKSLLALGNCINKLADGAKHIPYRDSNLTRIIKDSLGGNCQTVMIANVSPSSLTYEDTYNTLKYASRAKKIRSNVQLNMCKNNTPKDQLLRQLTEQQDELQSLREQVKQLQQRLVLAEGREAAATAAAAARTTATTAPAPATITEMVMMSGAQLSAELAPWYERIDAIYRALSHVMESRLRMDSEEKATLFRQEIKEHAYDAMKSLVLDGNTVKADIAWKNASVEKKKLPAAQQKLRQEYCARTAEKNLELNKLKREIANCEYADVLLRYVAGKQHEYVGIQKDFKNLHVLQINQIYYAEAKHLVSMLQLSAKIIQDDYYLLSASNMLDISMRENLEHLKRLSRGRRDTKSPAFTVLQQQQQQHQQLQITHQPYAQSSTSTQSSGILSAFTTGGSSSKMEDGSSLSSGIEANIMDRFNITMADPALDNHADDVDDDDEDDNEDYEDGDNAGVFDAAEANGQQHCKNASNEGPTAMDATVVLDRTVSIATAQGTVTKRRNRSSTTGTIASEAEMAAKKPMKKLFKADSFSVRSAVLGKSSSSTGNTSGSMAAPSTASSRPAMLPRASAHVSSVTGLSRQLIGQSAHQMVSGNELCGVSSASGSKRHAAFEAMDVEMATVSPSAAASGSQIGSNPSARSQQIKNKANLLRSILKENAASTLYQKVSKVNPKANVSPRQKAAPRHVINVLNKENKRSSPVRVSPRTKVAPRQNNASRARQRMMTATSTASSSSSSTGESTANLKNKFKVIPAK